MQTVFGFRSIEIYKSTNPQNPLKEESEKTSKNVIVLDRATFNLDLRLAGELIRLSQPTNLQAINETKDCEPNSARISLKALHLTKQKPLSSHSIVFSCRTILDYQVVLHSVIGCLELNTGGFANIEQSLVSTSEAIVTNFLLWKWIVFKLEEIWLSMRYASQEENRPKYFWVISVLGAFWLDLNPLVSCPLKYGLTIALLRQIQRCDDH